MRTSTTTGEFHTKTPVLYEVPKVVSYTTTTTKYHYYNYYYWGVMGFQWEDLTKTPSLYQVPKLRNTTTTTTTTVTVGHVGVPGDGQSENLSSL